MKRQEIKFIYNSTKKRDREAYGLINALNNYVVNEFDVSKNRMTETQLAELAHALRLPIDKLVDTHAEAYTGYDRSTSDSDTLLMIHRNMSLLITPIVKYPDGLAFILKTPFEVHPIDLEIEGTKNNRF